jgi:hypothetical protein
MFPKIVPVARTPLDASLQPQGPGWQCYSFVQVVGFGEKHAWSRCFRSRESCDADRAIESKYSGGMNDCTFNDKAYCYHYESTAENETPCFLTMDQCDRHSTSVATLSVEGRGLKRVTTCSDWE